ncbi:peptidyl-prolyl cis-trans isomerase sig-7-like [Euwallacea fornicatus]|uniref:peptidyl-prolyl cis-trans isomerase sig-7-like n=1 Tax=Euwallacea fornicatus TaxID=995702 RepID=UPI00338D95F4
MSVVIESTLGSITVDLYLSKRPRACLNFLKLCKLKYYNYNLFHTISRGFIAQTGDPTGSRSGGESIFGIIDGPTKRFFEAENEPRIKHTRPGLISFVGGEGNMIGSQFFLTLGEDLTYLDEKHCVFGEVVEGFEVLEMINEVICDKDDRPYQDVRITHTVILDDLYPDPKGFRVRSRSPSPSAEKLAGGRIAPDEEIDEISGKTNHEVLEMQAEREAKARATILEMVGDIPDADIAPPENVLFVCKLNPVTTDDDLEIIFSRFGKIKSCEVIRDRKTGDSLQYAFIEFEERKSCEDAFFKMANVLIDDRRIHVDFSQSVSKVRWLGKGRGVAHFDEKGNRTKKEGDRDPNKKNDKIAREILKKMDIKKNNSLNRSYREDSERRNKSSQRSKRRSSSFEDRRYNCKYSEREIDERHTCRNLSTSPNEKRSNRSWQEKRRSESPKHRGSNYNKSREFPSSRFPLTRSKFRQRKRNCQISPQRDSKNHKGHVATANRSTTKSEEDDKRRKQHPKKSRKKRTSSIECSSSSSNDEKAERKRKNKKKRRTSSSSEDSHDAGRNVKEKKRTKKNGRE